MRSVQGTHLVYVMEKDDPPGPFPDHFVTPLDLPLETELAQRLG